MMCLTVVVTVFPMVVTLWFLGFLGLGLGLVGVTVLTVGVTML